MSGRKRSNVTAFSCHDRGFALVITLTLVALLVLIVYALAALARVSSRISDSSVHQVQARQNALFAMDYALGKLQQYAGPDFRRTGMAGVVGTLPRSPFRQWAGVWDGTPSPVWLVSGATESPVPSLSGDRITIIGAHTVGSPTDTTDQEPVEVGLINLPGIDLVQGVAAANGRMAYWIGDEGCKVSAIIADAELQVSGKSGRGLRPNFRNLISGTFDPAAATNSRVISLEQLKVPVTDFSLSPAFHSLTRTHLALGTTANAGFPRPGPYVVGAFNINTTSEAAWRALLEFPDASNSAFGLSADRTLSAARQIRDRIAGRAQPFGSVSELMNSTIIQSAFDSSTPKITTITQDDFFAELAPILATRSDTFRIRTYGDVLDSVDHTSVQAVAYCEAIVQRTPDPAPGSLGQKFVILYFRWLGRDDI